MESLKCIRCKRPTSFEDMSKDASRMNGLRGTCKKCEAQSASEYRAKYPERFRATLRRCARKRLYGDAGIEHFEKQRELQGGLCAICHQQMAKACSDHDHETGRWRGMLCDSCNRAIGLLGERVEILESAIAYLRKWRA